VVGCFGSFITSKRGMHNYHGLACVSLTIATICMWIMWGMTWLMQWHPIVAPQAETTS